jgi:IS30 family transposase
MQADRDEIAELRRRGRSLRYIAGALGRPPSTIIEEVRRNKTNGQYDPKRAQHKAYVRRHTASFRGKKIVTHDRLRSFVERHLLDGQSPAAIAGRIRCHERRLPRLGKNTIYRFLDSPYGRIIQGKRKKKKPRRGRKHVTRLVGRRFIDERPEIIEKRGRVGDAEGDFIVSGKDGRGVLLTVVDRKLRTTFLEPIRTVTVDAVHVAFVRIHGRFPELRTLSLDNDILFQMHRTLETLLGIPIYFCHPYHSWEKGSVENVNGVIRRDIPKGSDLSRYDDDLFPALEEKLNGRFLECLGYATPTDALAAHRRRTARRNKKRTPVGVGA